MLILKGDAHLDGLVSSIVLLHFANEVIHVKAMTNAEAELLRSKLIESHVYDTHRLIYTSTMTANEQRNLTALALRIGPSDQRAWHNIKTIGVGLFYFLMVALLVLFALNMIKQNNKEIKFILPSKIKGSIDDLIGMEDIKTEVLRAKDFLSNRLRYLEYGVERPTNILFSGPPGTGKTKYSLGVPLHIQDIASD